MFSFFKRFKSGGSKAAETSPASAESPESVQSIESVESGNTVEPAAAAAPAPSTKSPEAPQVPETPETPKWPASSDMTLERDAASSDAPQALPTASSPATPSAYATPAAAPADALALASSVENAAHSEPAPVNVPTPRPAAQPAPTLAEPIATPAPIVVTDAHGDAIGEIVAAPAQTSAAKRSWLTRLKAGLSKTSAGLTGIFVGVKVDESLFEELEGALLMSDAGVEATAFLIDALRKKVKAERLAEGEQVKRALHDLLVELLQPLEQSLVLGRESPMVVMIAGVNGAGKTTSIGKLAKHFQHYHQSVLLAAGDTFRAAAREQLTIWGERNNVAVISQEGGDPGAVVFDAVNAARARKIDIVMADTAGRLPTQLHLMEELKKIKRVLGKAAEGAPHEVLLVIDANTGQNALAQVKAFDDALQLTGLIVTKLDGTAKGGILAAIARQRPVPVYFIGVGEKVEDLQPFSAREFADALLG